MAKQNLTDKERWEREKRILHLRSIGLSIVEIADREKCDLKTVRHNLGLIYKRYVDLMILDGANALAELVLQSDKVLALALDGFCQAKRVASVVVAGTKGEHIEVEVPDWNSKSLFLGKALEAIRLKATVLGFTRADVTPIINFIQSHNTQLNQQTVVGEDIKAEDVPKIRKHLRSARSLMCRAAARRVDVDEMHRLAGVKEVPAPSELPGVMREETHDAKGYEGTEPVPAGGSETAAETPATATEGA